MGRPERQLHQSNFLKIFPRLTAAQPSQRYTNQKLAREFGAALSEFQVVQRSSLEKERASKAALEQESSSAQSPSADRAGQSQQQLLEEPRLAQQSEVDYQEALIVEREGEIRQIEQSVGELNELFRDVAHIVREQGDVLDTIDANVENTVTDTRGADVELRSAARYQKSARSKACCLLLILAIVLIVVVLAVVIS